ncbi:MAG TPA: hypothetical protein VFP52_17680 [Myxococcales bacterium]|nr:hypothetical protein [Myxococcales bacterium]
MHALLAALFLMGAAMTRPARHPPRDPRTEGLGRSCRRNSDCKHRAQRCIRQSDAKGKAAAGGFCVLPCASFEAGTQKVTPGAPVDVSRKAKKPPPRCPPTYECRSAGNDVPLDMCVKQ